MKMDIKVDVLECIKAFKEIDQGMAAKALASGVNSSMLVIQNAAKKNIVASGAVETSLLHDSIGRVTSVYSNNNTICVTCGIDKSVVGVDRFGKKRWPFKYAHLVEDGTKDGRIKGKKFMRNAFDANKQEVLNRMVEVWQRKLAKYTE